VVIPGPPAPAKTARLVVSNHRSALDIAILIRHFGGNILSRGDVASWPLLGKVARRAGTIFVDRGEGGKRASAARAVRRRLADGATVTVFPEGTTFGDDEVRPFHAGVFAAAKGLDVEIVPVGMAYEAGAEYQEKTFLAHLGKTAARASTRVVMQIGEPLVVGAETRATSEACRAAVQKAVRAARAALALSPDRPEDGA
jgi:1-acyl-sn-glycerol-3-phosphate acyltransferase